MIMMNFKGLNETYKYDFTEGVLYDEYGNILDVNTMSSAMLALVAVNLQPSERNDYDRHLLENGILTITNYK